MSKKSNLFKFVTLRNPQLLDEDRKEQGFVFHPELSDQTSYFYEDVPTYSQLITDCGTFASSSLSNKSAVVDVFPKIYKFAFWLGKNKNSLTVEAIKKQLDLSGGITEVILDDANLKMAWDNIVYQTVKSTNKLVRESLIQILIANKFLKKFKSTITDAGILEFNDGLQLEFNRRATANVVIPKEFLPVVNKEVESTLKLSSVLTDRLSKGLETAMAQRRIMQLKNQLHNVKLEELNAHETVRLAKTAHIKTVKAHRAISANQLPVLDADGNDTGKITFTPLPTDDVYVEPPITTTATTVVDQKITTATRSTSSTFFRSIP